MHNNILIRKNGIIKHTTIRTSHCPDGPIVVGHRGLRVFDVPGRRHGSVVAPRVQVDVHRLDVRVDRISRVSGRSAASITDFLDVNVVQQETSLTADSADSDGRCSIAGYEVVHVLLPFAVCRYLLLDYECDVTPWQSNEAKLLGMKSVGVRSVEMERNSILCCLHCRKCLL